MKLTSDSPVLTAFALGELTEADSAAVAEALDRDESLRSESEAILALTNLLSGTLGGGALTLGEERIAEIHKAGQRPDPEVIVLEHRKRSRRQSLLAVAGVAAVVVTGFVALSRVNVESPANGTGANEVLGSGGGPGEGISGDDSSAPSSTLPGEVFPVEGVGIALPLNVGAADPAFVDQSLTEEGTLPPREDFEIEKWINLAEVTSEPQLTVGPVGVFSELGPCSWDSQKALLLINLRLLDGRKASLDAEVRFNPGRVKSARLLGGTDESHGEPSSLHRLEKSQSYLYEIELLEGEDRLGEVTIETLEGESGYLPMPSLIHGPEELSVGFMTAQVLGAYARWAQSSDRIPGKLPAIAKGARELLKLVADEKARYALDMVLLSEEVLIK